jgi:hypothetical protein
MPRYVKPTSIESPAVGNLYQARSLKGPAWKRVKHLRQQLRATPFGGAYIRLEIMRAEENHRMILKMERDALLVIEQRAQELGLTTVKPKADTSAS